MLLLQKERTLEGQLFQVEEQKRAFKLKVPSGQVSDPLETQHSSHNVDEEDSSNQLPKSRSSIAGRCPVVTVQIGGIDILCLVDSGSEVTTITESCYKKFFQGLLQDTHGWISLKAANGIEIPCIGLMETKVVMDDNIFDKVCILVVKDPKDKSTNDRKKEVPGVIGCNILQRIFQNPD